MEFYTTLSLVLLKPFSKRHCLDQRFVEKRMLEVFLHKFEVDFPYFSLPPRNSSTNPWSRYNSQRAFSCQPNRGLLFYNVVSQGCVFIVVDLQNWSKARNLSMCSYLRILRAKWASKTWVLHKPLFSVDNFFSFYTLIFALFLLGNQTEQYCFE